MAAWQAVGRWAAVLAAAALLAAPGFSSEPVAPTPVQKAEAPAAAKPADGVVPAWAKVSQLQIDSARKVGVPVAKELDLGGRITMKLVLIPAGKFLMGSPAGEKGRTDDEGPQREVTISKPFYMGLYHVTKGQFAQFVADSGYKTEAERDGKAWGWDGSKFAEIPGYSWRKTGFEQADDHPVVNVSWNDAIAFCEWASKKTGKKVSLPTEAQWEYACRAGTKTAYPWGDDPDDGKGWANAADQTAKKTFGATWTYFSWDDGYAFTSPAGKFKANAFGLYDMIGNAWEWCADWYDKGYYANANKTDPTGPASGTHRVLRGGAWGGGPRLCRSAYRGWDSPARRSGGIGFRVFVDLK